MRRTKRNLITAIIVVMGVTLFTAPSYGAMFCSVSSEKGVSSPCDVWDNDYSRRFARTLVTEADCTDPQSVGGCGVVYCKDSQNGGLRVWTCCDDAKACEHLYRIATKHWTDK